MVYGIGLGITVLLETENGFFITDRGKQNENGTTGQTGIIQKGI